MPMQEAALKDYRERIRAYMIKAVREAKLYTSWINQNEDYELDVDAFVCRCLDTNTNPMFLREFTEFEKRIRTPGLLNALAQSVLQLTSPGVPDIYQGSELWQFTLVDPDNRRPLDFDRHHQAMEQLEAMLAKPGQNRLQLLRALLASMEDGRIKLFVVMQTLRFRLRHTALFQAGDYLKINSQGTGAEHLLAFARRDQHNFAIIVVPRLIGSLHIDKPEPSDDLWNDTWLELPPAAPGEYREIFSQCTVAAQPAEEQLRLYLPPTFGLFPFTILSAAD
jgi:(1->4)-alpha-D-glucan 1-alpha-D-glucosylmutase